MLRQPVLDFYAVFNTRYSLSLRRCLHSDVEQQPINTPCSPVEQTEVYLVSEYDREPECGLARGCGRAHKFDHTGPRRMQSSETVPPPGAFSFERLTEAPSGVDCAQGIQTPRLMAPGHQVFVRGPFRLSRRGWLIGPTGVYVQGNWSGPSRQDSYRYFGGINDALLR